MAILVVHSQLRFEPIVQSATVAKPALPQPLSSAFPVNAVCAAASKLYVARMLHVGPRKLQVAGCTLYGAGCTLYVVWYVARRALYVVCCTAAYGA